VVTVGDSLAVEGLLNKLADITLRLTAQGIVISQFANGRFIRGLRKGFFVLRRKLLICGLLMCIVAALEDRVGVKLTILVQEGVLSSGI
jgi:hypothetical protein